MPGFTCIECGLDEEDIDDSVWADMSGNVDNPWFAYHVACLPNQKENHNVE